MRVLPFLLLLSSCFDLDGERATTRSVCGEMLECGGWGWKDREMCERELLKSGDYDGECRRKSAYLDCMSDCVELECDGFPECEADCWDASCA